MRFRSLTGFALFAITSFLSGCGTAPPAASGPQGLFDTHCSKCHAQAGEPGGPSIGSSKGPNLTRIGAEPGRTVDFLADYIRDPKTREPKAKMPGFENKLSNDEIRSLAEYLAAKK